MLYVDESLAQRLKTEAFAAMVGNIAVDELDLEQSWCASAFGVGNACAAGFTATVTRADMPLAIGDYVDLTAQSGDAVIPLGCFTLTQVKKHTNVNCWTLVGKDDMAVALEQIYQTDEVSQRAAVVWWAVAMQCGVDTRLLVDLPEGELATVNRTCRSLIGEIALLAGANAWIDRTGVLVLSRLVQSNRMIFPEEYYESGLELEENNFTVEVLTVTADDGTVYSATTGKARRGLTLRCGSITQSAFDGIWSAWHSQGFRPGRVELPWELCLDPGDLVQVMDNEGELFDLPALTIRRSYDGGWRTSITAYVSESGAAGSESVSQRLSGLQGSLAHTIPGTESAQHSGCYYRSVDGQQEWFNPPMELGVEYRTMERFLGKAVYAKVFDFGTLPNGGQKNVPHGLTATAVVGLEGASTNGRYHFPSAYSSERVDLYINASNLVVTTVGDWSSVSAYIMVKYTKD